MEDGGQNDAVSSENLQQVRRKARTGNLSIQSSKVIFLYVFYTVLRIRDSMPFWSLDPGSQTHIFESLITFFWVKVLSFFV